MMKGWKVTGYYTPLEGDYDEKVLKTVKIEEGGQRTFRAQFLKDVETGNCVRRSISSRFKHSRRGLGKNSARRLCWILWWHLAPKVRHQTLFLLCISGMLNENNSKNPLDANGGDLNLHSVAVDPKLIPFGTKLSIPTLPGSLCDRIFEAVDIGAVQGEGAGVKGKHIDVYCGEGKAAQELTYKITGKNHTVSINKWSQQRRATKQCQTKECIQRPDKNLTELCLRLSLGMKNAGFWPPNRTCMSRDWQFFVVVLSDRRGTVKRKNAQGAPVHCNSAVFPRRNSWYFRILCSLDPISPVCISCECRHSMEHA